MSLCWLQVISPAGVVRDLQRGFLRMEVIREQTQVLIVALGKTYPIKDQLKQEGFRWNPANKVWYYLGRPSTEEYEYLTEMVTFFTGPDSHFRWFERTDKVWIEVGH